MPGCLVEDTWAPYLGAEWEDHCRVSWGLQGEPVLQHLGAEWETYATVPGSRVGDLCPPES